MKSVLIAIICFTIFLFVTTDDHDREIDTMKEYCEMIQLYKDTNGEAGWPPYNGQPSCKF